MTFEPPIPRPLWDQVPPAAKAALTAVLRHYQQRIDALEGRVRDLEERLRQNSTNSSKPPSSDGPAVKRRPPPHGQLVNAYMRILPFASRSIFPTPPEG